MSDNEVKVIDIEIPFLSMVALMVKWALASIPALIILAFFGLMASGVFEAFVK